MSINFSTPWHKASFDQFLSDFLPLLLAERMPLAGYQVVGNDLPGVMCKIHVEVAGGVPLHLNVV